MTMRTIKRWCPLMVLPLVAASAAPVRPAAAVSTVKGDYVEVRTASVFAGACHYNGERVTEGRSALLAWRFAGGAVDGVDLTGAKVMAAVSSEQNLAEPAAVRTSQIVIDAKNDAVAAAAVRWVKANVGDQIGTVGSVCRASVAFSHEAGRYDVSTGAFAALSVQPMPDAACCSQPNLVWYQPFMAIDGKRVGYTVSAKLATTDAANTWNRGEENSAFYGTFGK